MASKEPTLEEIADFLRAIQGTRPLRAPERVVLDRPKPGPHPRQRELDDAAVVESLYGSLDIEEVFSDSDNFLRVGLHRNVLRDLRRGRWSIQNHVDLHGLNRHEAHEAVASFIAGSIAADKRCVRIVHGRGNGSPGRRGILRSLVKIWLIRNDGVLAFCHAPSFDGGEGVLWALLKSARKAAR
ncbi:MAG: Smr/MutS family protein [Candidatus Accumulibacter sp.]|jgi:DNA-nicking Smr family endonuclease|nr:Smr/MutS family protein [Accumulibacter sp.]